MDLANMRHNGVRSLAVQRHRRHEVVLNVDHLPDDVTVPAHELRDHRRRRPAALGRAAAAGDADRRAMALIPHRPGEDEKTAWAPELIVIGALVFAFGLLIGAGIAALLGPPG